MTIRKISSDAIESGSITESLLHINVSNKVNAAYATANTANSAGSGGYDQANNAYAQANAAYGKANAAATIAENAYAQANTARTTANDAYGAANTKLSTSGGSISGDVAITGNLTVTGNATTMNVSNLSVNDSIILLSTNAVGDSNDIGFVGHFDRGATATHAGLIRKATQNQFYLFDNYEVEPTNNVIDVAGNNFTVGNLRLGIINANSFVTAAGLDVTGQANAAYGAANNRVLKVGDTMTGQLNISSGGLLVTGNVGIGTTNPVDILDVRGGSFYFNRGTGNLGNRYVYINKGASNDGGLLLSRDNALDWQIINNTTSGDLGFYSYGAGAQVFYIKRSDGNVGINTTSPGNKLDIWGDDGGNGGIRLLTKTSGTGSYQQIALIRNTGSTVNDGFFQLFDNGTAKINMAANAARGGDAYFNTGGALIVNGTGTVNGATLTAIRTDLSSSLSVGYFGTGSQGLYIKNDSSDSRYMQFYSSGNTGGGYRFYVGNTLAFQLDTAATANFYNNLGVSGSGSFGSSVLCLRGSQSSGNGDYLSDLDGYGGSSYDGYYAVGRPGYSSFAMQFNVGGSVGTVQFAGSYNTAMYRRNKTDNNVWSSWRQVD